MIFYTWRLYIISCVHHVLYEFITKVTNENYSKALSLLVYIADTRFLIYYQYLFVAIDVKGP